MSSAKQIVRDILDKLPDDATFEDISYEIYVKLNINIARDQIKNGEFFSEEEVFKRYEQCIK